MMTVDSLKSHLPRRAETRSAGAFRLRWAFALSLTLLLHSAPSGLAQDSRAELEAREEQSFKQATALASASVVRIETVGGLDRIGQVLTGTGPTTGVVVSEDGYIISSAFNFASKPASILVTLPDGRRVTAEQIANDKARMLTLLKVDAKDLIVPQPTPKDAYRVGQWAIALGRTFDDELPSVSVGIVSALNRIWGKALQTDAKISPTNYGGPLIDVDGHILGILVPLSPRANGEIAGVEWYDSGIGFAIPFADVLAALDRLKTGKDLLPGLMGVTFKGTNIYEGLPTLDRVRYGSPAHEAGMRTDDVIVAMEGHPVTRQAQVRHLLGNKYADEQISVTYKRGDESFTKELTLVGELTPYETPFLGVLPARLDPEKPAKAGVEVRHVFPKSGADVSGIAIGERILSVDGTDVVDAASLTDLVSRARPQDQIKLQVVGEADPREVVVTLGSFPSDVPEELRRQFIPVPEPRLPPDMPKVGRFTAKSEAHEHDYWCYVPEDYNPAYRYGLLVWIHPNGDTMEASMNKSWKSYCDERGIIMLGPKAKEISGWQASEEGFVKELTEKIIEDYAIDPNRVALHTFSNGGGFGFPFVMKNREIFKGAIIAGFPLRVPPPDNEAELRFQIYLVCGEKDPQVTGIRATAKGLGNLKYPVVFRTIPEAGPEYPEVQVDEIVRWLDSLDRI